MSLENKIYTFHIHTYLDNPLQLPMAKVDQGHVDNGTQCPICMETFNLDEQVVKLNCQVPIPPNMALPFNHFLSSTYSIGHASCLGCRTMTLAQTAGETYK